MGFKSSNEHRREKELEEARKAGLAPAEVDKDGKEINPHIPGYMVNVPFYLNNREEEKSLDHQKNWKFDLKIKSNAWYSRGVKTHQADKYRKGACENCGAMSHDAKSCMERPRKKGAKLTNMFIAPDEKVESLDLSYEAKRDRWNGFDAGVYGQEIQIRFEKAEDARLKYLKEQQLKKLEKESSDPSNENQEGSNDDEEDDGLKIDDTKQVGFAKVEKRVRTTGGGSSGTVQNLRLREDIAKYLRNLDLASAHYDPKTRSMREDPNPDMDPNEKFYAGDNMYRNSGQAIEFKELHIHAWEAYDRGQDVHVQAAPSQAELLHNNFKAIREKVITKKKDTIKEKYGDAAAEEEIPKELLLGQTEIEIEYDRTGRIIKGEVSVILPKSKYDEDIYLNNHTTIWGSWWKDGQWGYKCCKQLTKNRYCTGLAGIEAVEASVELMMANMARKEVAEKVDDVEVEKKNLATWGSDIADDLVLDAKKLAEALKKEGGRKKEESDKRKRKYNVSWDDEVTAEDMEAYRIKRSHYDDPMNQFKD
ncbi:hypothetical protein ACHQM5_013865 [Ranunculus cassubicifolius]